MEELLGYGFIQRALIGGIFIAVACALLGVFLVLRRNAMFAHGLAHVVFAGVALGLFFKIGVLGAGVAVSVIAALGMLKLRHKAGLHFDTAIGIFSAVGMALGIILVSLARSFNVDLFSYLFGEILAIEPHEVWLSLGLLSAVLVVILIFYRKFLFIAFDSETAKASGIRVEILDSLLIILAALTVVLGMKIVGLIFVTALVVIPAAAALQIAGSFKSALLISAATALVSVLGGLYGAFSFDIPAGGSIVIFSFLIFCVLFTIKKVRQLF